MNLNTIELDGVMLDWAVAKCADLPFPFVYDERGEAVAVSPSTDWAQCGPIIERERITICSNTDSTWWAVHPETELEVHGATALQAAMRAYVHAKMGEVVT